jgi:hypothetical protein
MSKPKVTSREVINDGVLALRYIGVFLTFVPLVAIGWCIFKLRK